jgi:hypothetical protein
MADLHDIEFGFYNSLNGDRKYSSVDISRIFDGLIDDGIFLTYGGHFDVNDSRLVNGTNGMQVYINTGRAWFDHTYSVSDVVIVRDIAQASNSYPRIDTVVLETNAQIRTNSIKVITGEATANPVAPALTNTATIHQYPLADITVPKGATSISLANIRNRIGTDDCPYATSLLDGEVDSIVTRELARYLSDDGSALYEKLENSIVNIVYFHRYYRGDVSCTWSYQQLRQLIMDQSPIIAVLEVDDADPTSENSVIYYGSLCAECEQRANSTNLGHVVFSFLADIESGLVYRCGYDGLSGDPFVDVEYLKPLRVYFETDSGGTPSCSHTFYELRSMLMFGRSIEVYFKTSANGLAGPATLTLSRDSSGTLLGLTAVICDMQPNGQNIEDWGWDRESYGYTPSGLTHNSDSQ